MTAGLSHRAPWVALGAVALVALACAKELFFGPGPVAGVRVAPDSAALQVGDTVRLSGVPVDTAGSALFDMPVTWSSTAPHVATVDERGLVQGVSLGTAIVTASVEGASETATVVVEPPPAIGFDPVEPVITASIGAPDPTPATVAIVNTGGGTLAGLALGEVVYQAGASGWLSATLVGTTEPASITLSVATALLTRAGTYGASVPVSSEGATNSPQSLTVSLVLEPGTPAALAKAAGDNQVGVAGAPLPVAPTVVVRDGFGNARPGVEVLFVVTSGNGSVTAPADTTDAQGLASVSWTVRAGAESPPDGRYPNALEASVAGVASVTFTASAVYSFATHVQPIFSSSCTFSQCHAVGVVPPALTPGVAYGQIVGVTSACGTGNRVEPGSSVASALMQLMDSIPAGGCIRSMPPRNRLADSLRNVVRSWIRNSAPDN